MPSARTFLAAAVVTQLSVFATTVYLHRVLAHRALTIRPGVALVFRLILWIMTGIISLTVGWRSGVELLVNTVVGPLAAPAVVAGALADMAVGALIAWRPTSRLGLCGAITVSLFYAVAGTLLRPDLWSEPLGPLMKILPILVLHFVALAILEER